MDTITIALAAVVFILAAILWYMLGLGPACPECGTRRVSEVGREPLGMRAIPMDGGDGGGRSGVQLRYDVRYRCGECDAAWTQVETETG